MPEQLHNTFSRLLLKPADNNTELLYSFYETELGARISFCSLNLERDMDMIHRWVNESYAKKFWQLNGSIDLVRSTYQMILNNPRAHSFITLLDDKPIAQVDVYGVHGDEVGNHVNNANELDCGLHLLMLPTKELQKGWSFYTLRNFQRWYFSLADHNTLYAEPDQANVLANKLAIDAGFTFLKTIQLSNKIANLYSITREQCN